MDTKRLQFHYFIGLLLIVLGLTLALFWPFIAAIALAFMAAIIVRPVHRWMLRLFGGKPTLSAVITVLFVLVVILVPLALMVSQIVIEAVNFYNGFQQGDAASTVNAMLQPIQSVFPSFTPDVQGYMSSFTDAVVGNARSLFSSTASLALDIFIAVIALFYMLRDGHRFKKAIVELSPLADAYDEQIIAKIERAVNSVVRGSLFVSLIRGALTAVGFAFFGVPHPILWGAVTALVSLLPNIGLFITLVPAVVYLLGNSAMWPAIGLTLWSIVVIGLVDNVVMPVVMGKGFTVHPLFILLSILGGLVFFGPVGLLLGPLVIALLSALLEIYKLIVIEDHSRGASPHLR